MNDKQLNQEGGNNAKLFQAVTQHITNNFNGIDEREAKSISLRLWKENAEKLSIEATNTAIDRITHFIDKLFNDKMAHSPELIKSLQDPGMQMIMLSAQRAYAKSGEPIIEDLLIEFLAKRAEFPKRNTEQIFVDECIKTISSLSSEQIDTLTLIHLYKKIKILDLHNTKDYETAKNEYEIYLSDIETMIKPFMTDISTSELLYTQLEHYGCVRIAINEDRSFIDDINNTYPSLFRNWILANDYEYIMNNAGFNMPPEYFIRKTETVKNLIGRLEYKLSPDLYAHLSDRIFYQITLIPAAATIDLVSSVIEFNNFDEYDLNRASNHIDSVLKQLFNRVRMSSSEALDIVGKNFPFVKKCCQTFNWSLMRSCYLTQIGQVIAEANLKRNSVLSTPDSNDS